MINAHQKKICKRTMLYSIVFESIAVKCAVLFLFGFLLLEPASLAFAAVNDESVPPVETEEANIPSEVTEQEIAQKNQAQALQEATLVDDEAFEDSEVLSRDTTDTTSFTNASSSTADENNDTETPLDESLEIDAGDVLQTASSTGSDVLNTSATTSGAGIELLDIISSSTNASTTPHYPDEPDEEIADGEPLPVLDTVEPQEEIITDEIKHSTSAPLLQISDANRYQFSTEECVHTGDGAYYCSKTKSNAGSLSEDGAYSIIDEQGDSEIFVQKRGKEIQITDNEYEDSSPHFDPLSDTVVWHRLVNGRYEIMQYSFDTSEEKSLTSNSSNDTEPSASGNYVVWQRWVDSNWEIILYSDGEELQLTSNATHDVVPQIRGGYVIWHATGQNGQTHIGVYEIETKLTSTIEDQENGMVENPRFVLVYDTTFENGDTITKGYDFESGSIVPLNSDPYVPPVELPTPDTTGETKALIQNKSPNPKDSLQEEQGAPGGDNLSSGTTTPNSAASSSSPALDQELPFSLDLSTSSGQILPLTDFDIVVLPYIASSSAQEFNSTTSSNLVE